MNHLLLFILFVCALPSHAVVPPKRINFQGKLLDASNTPRNGTFNISFKLYDVPAGGTPFYSESQDIVVTNGVFSAQIGAAGDLSSDLFARTSTYLGITVSPDAEMTPRQQLAMSPYAFVAARLMRGKDIVVNPGVSYSTFTVGGDLLVENGVSADTATFNNYVDLNGSAAPSLPTSGVTRLYYDSTADEYLASVSGRNFTPLGTASVTLWNTNATAGVASQGLNLPAALTEFNNGIQGSRMTINCDDLPSQLALRYNIRGLTAATLTLVISVRDTSNTANVLATVSQAVSAVNTTYTGQGAFAAKPAWCAGQKQVAIYASGGNGAADYVFPHIILVGKP